MLIFFAISVHATCQLHGEISHMYSLLHMCIRARDGMHMHACCRTKIPQFRKQISPTCQPISPVKARRILISLSRSIAARSLPLLLAHIFANARECALRAPMVHAIVYFRCAIYRLPLKRDAHQPPGKRGAWRPR